MRMLVPPAVKEPEMSPLVVGIARTGVMLVAIVLSLPKGGAFFSKVCLASLLQIGYPFDRRSQCPVIQKVVSELILGRNIMTPVNVDTILAYLRIGWLNKMELPQRNVQNSSVVSEPRSYASN
jgi:hypothetical protein